jgi:hypothetical protein
MHRLRAYRYKLSPLKHVPQRTVIDIPYFAQWESPELVADIVEGKKDAADDPLWRNSGAKDKEEYVRWSWSACGLACTKMILAHASGEVVPIVMLGNKALAYGCYDMPLETSIGLKYGPYSEFTREEFGWETAPVSPMVLEDIIKAIAKGSYVMISVTAEIRRPHVWPKRHGGHLVLAVGYDLDASELLINNPSGDKKETQDHARVSFSDFEKFFAHKGIVITV